MRGRSTLLTLVLGAASAACATGGADVTGASPLSGGLVGATWQLTAIEKTGQAPEAVPAGLFALELRDSGDIHLVADCNQCNGRYRLGEGTLEVEGGVLACTRAFCQSAPLDTDYVDLVAGVRSWEADASHLTLSGDAGRLSFARGGSE